MSRCGRFASLGVRSVKRRGAAPERQAQRLFRAQRHLRRECALTFQIVADALGDVSVVFDDQDVRFHDLRCGVISDA